MTTGISRACRAGETPHVEYIASYGGAGQREALHTVIIREAREPGNVAKLSGDSPRRHLFIEIHRTAGDAYVAARNAVLPVDLPELPEQITNLWIWAEEPRVFEFTRHDGWVEHPISVDVLTTPESLEPPEDER